MSFQVASGMRCCTKPLPSTSVKCPLASQVLRTMSSSPESGFVACNSFVMCPRSPRRTLPLCTLHSMEMHPKGSRARVLLSSVFGTYAQDDEFGSRRINPMELYHNQVTRAQGSFSLRMFHRSWGIMMIQENISAPSTVLDFPTRDAFARELTEHHYDIVGISSIIVNVGKVREMCRLVRKLSPGSTIVIGGHVAAIPDIEQQIDADHIVRGDGVAWMREYLGEEVKAPIRHPHIVSGFD